MPSSKTTYELDRDKLAETSDFLRAMWELTMPDKVDLPGTGKDELIIPSCGGETGRDEG
jgi:hypothetical protein